MQPLIGGSRHLAPTLVKLSWTRYRRKPFFSSCCYLFHKSTRSLRAPLWPAEVSNNPPPSSVTNSFFAVYDLLSLWTSFGKNKCLTIFEWRIAQFFTVKLIIFLDEWSDIREKEEYLSRYESSSCSEYKNFLLKHIPAELWYTKKGKENYIDPYNIAIVAQSKPKI